MFQGSVGVFKKKHGSAENDLMFFLFKTWSFGSFFHFQDGWKSPSRRCDMGFLLKSQLRTGKIDGFIWMVMASHGSGK